MEKFYLANQNRKIETIWAESAADAFRAAQSRNREHYECWKAYDERGQLIYGVATFRSGEPASEKIYRS